MTIKQLLDNMTTHFYNAIKEYCDVNASFDIRFGEKYNARIKADGEEKAIQGCCNFIASEIKKQATKDNPLVGVTDDEVYGLALHYFDENINAPQFSQYKVVTNNPVLTDEEKQQAHANAVEQYQKEQLSKMRKKPVKETKKETSVQQLDLFA